MTIPITPTTVDAIVALVAIEGAVAGALLVRAGATKLVAPLLFHLASGASLLLALRAALGTPDLRVVALALLASLVAHGASLHSAYRAILRGSSQGHGARETR